MLVANSFDLWQRDAFFSAAEEVQESTDILESAYRTWFSAKRERVSANDLDDLRRELQTALSTAKWQLDEFERAVRLSYGHCRDQSRMARHQQFVVAIESQISRAEDALRESLNEEGKQPFRWVNLDEDERDDLALFLSGGSAKSKREVSETPFISSAKEYKKRDLDYAACSSSCSTGSHIQKKGLTSSRDDVVINMEEPDLFLEQSTREALGSRGDVNSEEDRTRSTKRTQVSPKFDSLSILIPDGDDQMRTLMPTVEATPKKKGSRSSYFLHSKGMNCINKIFGCSSGVNSGMQISRRLQFGSSMRLIIILMLSFFLLVPYLLQ